MPINHNPISPSEQNTPPNRNTSNKNSPVFTLSEPLYSFDDIILPAETKKEIENVIALEKYKDLLYNTWGLGKVFKQPRNISINLYGYSGTGKTMTAHAIANTLKKKVLIVNYAEIESKYVGETSKNLEALFRYAAGQDAVILFDEADALLSKRVTAMHTAADVSVNQTRNVLLKILDQYQGVVIFTTNFIQNFDHAFMRRILSHIKFDLPNQETREKLWTHYLVDSLPLAEGKVQMIKRLSSTGGITGSDISTSILKAAVSLAVAGQGTISEESLLNELTKLSDVKERMEGGKYQITTRKVSEEYAREQLEKGDISHGAT